MSLFSEFSAVSYDEWLAQLKKDLKTDNVERYLTTRTEGLIHPSYLTREHVAESSFPLAQRVAHHPEFAFANEWEICVNVPTNDLLQSNREALAALEQGATAIRFTGHEISNQEELILCLRDIQPELISLHFDCGEAAPSLLFLYQDEIARRKLDPSTIQGSIGYDPFGDYAFKGVFDYSREESLSMLQSLIRFGADELPSFKTLTVNAAGWHNAGATAVQELAFSLSTLAEYFTGLDAAGLRPEVVANTVQLRLASGADYFLNMAKFRSIRLLWNMLLEGFGLDVGKHPLFLATETALRNKTIYDPHNNLLRATSESMAAIIGGTDEHTIHPHDYIFREPDRHSRRLALNIQHLLKYESHLDKVSDAAAGSYYIEKITQELTEKAWELLLQLEREGGFLASLRTGQIQEQVIASRAGTEQAVRSRKRVIVGVSQYARAGETVPPRQDEQRDPLKKVPEIKVVEPFREAAVFEALRQHFTRKKIPLAFLAVFGDPVKRTARAGFSADFMAIAGFASEQGDPSVTPEDQLHSKAAQKADVIVLCAADEEYVAAFEAIRKQGLPTVPLLVAGKPETEEQLRQQGASDFIYVGCDAAAVFRNLIGADIVK